MDMNRLRRNKWLLIRTGILFFVILILCHLGFDFFNKFQEKEGRLEAAYTAEASVRNLETQIGRYLENSDLLKNIIASGYSIEGAEFDRLADLMMENKDAIEAYELAPDGVVESVYPYEKNKKAIGLNMLEMDERKAEAEKAKESGEYTIAGPFELKQGGVGVIIFDPIYVDDEFWGFSMLVLNWDSFLSELHIDKLQEANYQFDVWKMDSDGNRVTIMNDGYGDIENALTVSCTVPNDIWYFDIYPKAGWIPIHIRALELTLSFVFSALFAFIYLQRELRKRHEEAYARALEESVKQANTANEAKTQFLLNMSHDIRTPMNAIIGYSELLEDNLDSDDKAMGYVKKIKESSDLLLSLINYVLEMARIESGKMELREETGSFKNFVKVLDAVIEPQIDRKKLEFVRDFDIKHENIICDITKFREIVLNILSNAVKYTPDNGRVIFSIKEMESDREDYADYCIEVEDNGIGMHEDYLPHIFEPFSRERTSTESKVAGAGLGLPIVKALVDLMDGNIEVESRLGQGTRFTIYLSFLIAEDEEPAEEAAIDNSDDEKTVILKGKRVLLVEDNELNAEIATEILTREGVNIDRAENGSCCLAALDSRPELYYDLILMDIQMPIMDGYEAARAIRRLDNKNAGIPIIAMTANAFKEDIDKCIKAGMNAHLAKPINIDNLITTMQRVLENQNNF